MSTSPPTNGSGCCIAVFGDVFNLSAMFHLRGPTVSWRTTLRIQRALSRLPVPLGDSVYHLAQKINGLTISVKFHRKFVDRCERSLSALGRGSFEERLIVELGSGWFPVTPMLLLSRGARGIRTFDLHKHYSKRRIRQAASAMLTHAAHPDIEQAAASGKLPGAIRYHPRCDLATANLPAASVDVAISQFVLEHVRPADIERIHRASLKWLADDGLWIHWISPGDHRAYGDTALSQVDFLRYSHAEWDRIAGNRFAYHNRLRRSQYRDLFERCGWTAVIEDSYVPEEARRQLSRVPLHSDYSGLAPDDLVAGSLWFVLTKKRPTSGWRSSNAPVSATTA